MQHTDRTASHTAGFVPRRYGAVLCRVISRLKIGGSDRDALPGRIYPRYTGSLCRRISSSISGIQAGVILTLSPRENRRFCGSGRGIGDISQGGDNDAARVSWNPRRVRVPGAVAGCGWSSGGTQFGSDGGLPVMRELDDAPTNRQAGKGYAFPAFVIPQPVMGKDNVGSAELCRVDVKTASGRPPDARSGMSFQRLSGNSATCGRTPRHRAPRPHPCAP